MPSACFQDVYTLWIASKHAESMSLRYDESLNLTPFFKTQDTQLTAVPQKRLLFYLPLQFWQGIFKIICQN